jgi:hypothetical protein
MVDPIALGIPHGWRPRIICDVTDALVDDSLRQAVLMRRTALPRRARPDRLPDHRTRPARPGVAAKATCTIAQAERGRHTPVLGFTGSGAGYVARRG